VDLFDAETLAPLQEPYRDPDEHWGTGVSWSKDGRRLFSSWRDVGVVFLDSASLAMIIRVPLPGWSRVFTDGTRLFALSNDRLLSLDPETRATAVIEDGVTAIALEPRGKLLATANKDTKLRLLSFETTKPLAEPFATGQRVDRIAVSGSGRFLALARGRQIRFLEIQREKPDSSEKLTLVEAGSLPVSGTVSALAFRPAREGEGDVLAYGISEQFGIVGVVPLEDAFSGPDPKTVLEEVEEKTGLKRLPEDAIGGR